MGKEELKKKTWIVLAVLACVFMMTRCSVKTVPAGYVGVKVQLYGSDKGVQQTVVGVGRYWLTMTCISQEIMQLRRLLSLSSHNSN